MAVNLYIVRHAEAEGNLYRRAHGRYDGLLTATGKRQLKALAARFEGITIDAAYSSDLIRARMTGEAVLKARGIPVIPKREFSEIGLGVWEDRPWGEIIYKDWEQYKLFESDTERWSVEGCEPALEAGLRFYNAVIDVASRHEGQTVAIFAHGSVIRMFLKLVYSASPGAKCKEAGYCDNTAVTHIVYDGGRLTVQYEYDSSHLGELSTIERHKHLPIEQRYNANTRYRPLDLNKERDIFLGFISDSWLGVYGSFKGFDTDEYLSKAIKAAETDPDCLALVLLKDEIAGLVQLDPKSGEEEKSGNISLLYMREKFRGMSLGIQPVGYAVSYFRKRGCDFVTLTVSEKNKRALGFYEYYGFERVGIKSGVNSRLYTMRLDISRPKSLST